MTFREFHKNILKFHLFWCITETKDLKSRKWLNFRRFLHLFFLAAISILCFIYEDSVFAQGDPVSTFVDVIQMVFPVSIHVVVIIEAIFKRNLEFECQNLISNLETFFEKQKFSVIFFDLKLKRRFFFSAITVQSVSLVVEIIIIATITESPDWMRNWFSRILSFAFGRIAIFYYILTVEYLSSRFRLLHCELVKLQDNCEEQGPQFDLISDKLLCERIKSIKSAHLKLWRLCDLHNQRHSWFILCAVTSFFICLTIDFFWMFANMHYGDNIFIAREDWVAILICDKEISSPNFPFRVFSLRNSPDFDGLCHLRGLPEHVHDSRVHPAQSE